MLIIWRFILLLILFLAALICFPDYPNTALVSIFMMFMVAFTAVLILTFIFSLLMIGRSNTFNHFFDIVIILVIGYLILTSLEQTDGVKPLDKLKNGNYPTQETIIKGIKRFNFRSIDIEKEIKNTTNELKNTTDKIERIVVKEAKG